MKYRIHNAFITLLAICAIPACSTISPYDKTAYDKATGAKAEALALVDAATESYSSRAAQTEAVLLTVDKAYEYDRGRPLNGITVKLWDKLRDPNGHLFGGFVKRWKEKKSLKREYIDLKKPDISEAFDQIIQLELVKRSTTPSSN